MICDIAMKSLLEKYNGIILFKNNFSVYCERNRKTIILHLNIDDYIISLHFFNKTIDNKNFIQKHTNLMNTGKSIMNTDIFSK